MRLLVLVVAVACSSHDKSAAPGVTNGDVHTVTVRLSPSAIDVEGKAGKHTFQLESGKPTPALVKPVIDEILATGGKNGVTVWGRYDAPYVWNALAPALSDVPTTICLRDGANC